MAGPELAGRSRVRSLVRGLLTVEVDSAPLCHRLASFEQRDLLAKLLEVIRKAEVTDLRFRVGAIARGSDSDV